MIDESERLTNGLSNAQEDIGRISILLEKTDKEKRRLQEKNAKLTITGEMIAYEGNPVYSKSYMFYLALYIF